MKLKVSFSKRDFGDKKKKKKKKKNIVRKWVIKRIPYELQLGMSILKLKIVQFTP